MITIWKFPLTVDKSQVLTLPIGYKILTVKTQNNIPTLWAGLNSSSNEMVNVEIVTHTTGAVINAGQGLEYIDTYMLDDGEFVGHVFVVL